MNRSMPRPNGPSAPSRSVPDRSRVLALALGEEFDVSFRVYDGSTGEALGDRVTEERHIPPPATAALVLAVAADGRPHVSASELNRFRIALPLKELDGPTLVAIGELPALARTDQDRKREQSQLQKWAQAVQHRLSIANRPVIKPSNRGSNDDQLSKTLTAVLELGEIIRGLQTSGEPGDYATYVLDRVQTVLSVGAVIWTPARGGEPVITGASLLSAQDCRRLTEVLSQSPAWDPSGFLILNELRTNGLGTQFPGVINLMALSTDPDQTGGCLIVLNKTDSRAANRSGRMTGAQGVVERPASLSTCFRDRSGRNRPSPADRYRLVDAVRRAAGVSIPKLTPSASIP